MLYKKSQVRLGRLPEGLICDNWGFETS